MVSCYVSCSMLISCMNEIIFTEISKDIFNGIELLKILINTFIH